MVSEEFGERVLASSGDRFYGLVVISRRRIGPSRRTSSPALNLIRTVPLFTSTASNVLVPLYLWRISFSFLPIFLYVSSEPAPCVPPNQFQGKSSSLSGNADMYIAGGVAHRYHMKMTVCMNTMCRMLMPNSTDERVWNIG